MALAGRTHLGTRTAVRSRQSAQRPCIRRVQPVSRRVIPTQALFNFLAPKTQTKNPRAAELAEDLVEVCSGGKPAAGAVEQLVEELSQFSTPNPLRSPLLWGTYDVLYCSKPTAVGGPLKKGPGPVVFPGQIARQTLEEPNVLINEVEFKTFGFLPGSTRQVGTIQPVSGDTFLLNIQEGQVNLGLGAQQKQFNIQRRIQIVYLDETLRIARFLPDESLEDSEADQATAQRESEEILFVFKRVAEEAEAAEEEVEEEEEEQEESRAKSPLANLFGGTARTTAGLATQAERQIRQQMRQEGGATTSGTAATNQGGTRRIAALPSFGTKRRAVQEQEEEAEDPREARRRAQEEARAQRAAEQEARRREEERERAAEEKRRAAEEAKARKQAEAEAKVKAAQEARERAEAERAERAERAAAIKELLGDLTDKAREAAAATKEAATALREVQRENGQLLKQVAAAEAEVEEAERDVQKVEAALEEAAGARKAAEQELKEAQQRLKEAQATLRLKAEAAFAPR